MYPTPPILFMIFNRPDLTAKTFETIRQAKPAHLFVSADGPRASREDDAELCQQTREIIEQVDWDCEVKTKFRDKNVGLQTAMSQGMGWFFEHVEAGIILEDDNAIDPSYFQLTAELLERYRDDERVMSIAAENCFLNETSYETSDSYVFSVLPTIWGWATWRRAWQHYDHSMSAWDTSESRAKVMAHFDRDHDRKYWGHEFGEAHSGRLKTCGYRWVMSCLARGGLHIIPYNNLSSNIGFDERASHTYNDSSPDANRSIQPIALPLVHPQEVARDKEAELAMMDARYQTKTWYRKNIIGKRLHRRMLRKVKRSMATCLLRVFCSTVPYCWIETLAMSGV